MDEAAHPAGEAFLAQPKAPSALAKPAEPPPLEPGARWKALPYKLRKRIENLPALVFMASIAALGAMLAVTLETKRAGYWYLDKAALEAQISQLVGLTILLAALLFVVNFLVILHLVVPYWSAILDGTKGLVVKWVGRFADAWTRARGMTVEEALRPGGDVRAEKQRGADAAIFGALAFAFLLVAILVEHFQRDLERLTEAQDVGGLSPVQALSATVFLAGFVLGCFAVLKVARFGWAWRAWAMAVAKRALAWTWLEVKNHEFWKELASIRPAATLLRASIFVVLLALAVVLSHFTIRMAVDSSVRRSLGPTANLAVCATECFSWLHVRDFTKKSKRNSVSVTPHLTSPREYFEDAFPNLFRWNWYFEESYANFMEEQDSRSKGMGWTEKTIAPIVARGQADVEKLRALSPMGVDEFETLIASLQADGVKVTRDKDRFAFQAQNLEASIHLNREVTCRARLAEGVLTVLQTSKTSESYRSFDFASSVVVLGLIQAAPRTPAKASLHPFGLI